MKFCKNLCFHSFAGGLVPVALVVKGAAVVMETTVVFVASSVLLAFVI